jgi:hypothetical protein
VIRTWQEHLPDGNRTGKLHTALHAARDQLVQTAGVIVDTVRSAAWYWTTSSPTGGHGSTPEP